MAKKEKAIQVLLDADHADRIAHAAAARGLSLSATVRSVLIEAFPLEPSKGPKKAKARK